MFDLYAKLNRSKKFAVCVLFFIFGIYLAGFIKINILFILLAIVFIALFLLIVGGIQEFPLQLIMLFLLLGLWRGTIAIQSIPTSDFFQFTNAKIETIGQVASDPEISSDSIKFEFNPQDFNQEKISSQENILVKASRYPEIKYGQTLKLTCTLERPQSFNDFDYQGYLARYNLKFICAFPKIEILPNAKSTWNNRFWQAAYWLKDSARRSINAGMTEPEAGLARAIVLGDKWAVPKDINTAFSNSGLSHIMAISGMNIAMLAVIFGAVLYWCGITRKHNFIFLAAILVFYVAMIGFPASAVRALWMGVAGLYAVQIGRLVYFNRLMAVSAGIMLLVNPLLLKYDVGFVLSFLALFGLANFYPLLMKIFPVQNKYVKFVVAIFLATIAAQLVAVPILISTFKQLSLDSPLANVATVWTLSFIMSTTLSGIALSWIIPGSEQLVFLTAKILIFYLYKVTQFFGELPHASIAINNFGWAAVIIYYLCLIFAYLKLKKIAMKDLN